MMILSRRIGERIIIGTGEDEIIIELIDAADDYASIGIDAPRDVPIDREEIRDKKERNGDFYLPKQSKTASTVWNGGARKMVKGE